MSRKGNCLDNSPMENFFAILKQEMYYGNTFHSYDELKMAIENYIIYYNTKRIVNDTLRMYKNDDIRMYNFNCITDTIVEVITTCNTYTLLTVHLL